MKIELIKTTKHVDSTSDLIKTLLKELDELYDDLEYQKLPPSPSDDCLEIETINKKIQIRENIINKLTKR